MKRLLWIPVVLSLTACHPPVTIQTPQGAIAYSADQVAVQIARAQNAIIQANQATPKGIRDSVAIPLVQFCVIAEGALQNAPQGWQAAVKSAWANAGTSLPPLDQQTPLEQTIISGLILLVGSL